MVDHIREQKHVQQIKTSEIRQMLDRDSYKHGSGRKKRGDASAEHHCLVIRPGEHHHPTCRDAKFPIDIPYFADIIGIC